MRGLPTRGPQGTIDTRNPVADHELNEGLVGWWLPFGAWQGGDKLRDLTGRNPGTLTNGPTWAPGPGGFGAVQTDGSNDHLSFAETLPALVGSSYTVAALVRNLNTAQTNTYALNLNDGGTDRALIYGYVANKYEFFAGPRTQINPTVDGGWHLVGWSYDAPATTVTPYWDGLVGSGGAISASAAGFGSAPTLRLATSTGSIDFHAGSFGGLWIWSRDIGAAGWRSLYDQSRRGYPDLLRRVRPWSAGVDAGGAPAAVTWFDMTTPAAGARPTQMVCF